MNMMLVLLFHVIYWMHVTASGDAVHLTTPIIFQDAHQAHLVRRLLDYDIVLPRKVSQDGQRVLDRDLFHSYSVSTIRHQSAKRRRRRSLADAAESNSLRNADVSDDHHVHYRFNISGREKHFHLKPNIDLLSPGFVIERFSAANSSFHLRPSLRNGRLEKARDRQCHFVGEVRGHPGSQVAISTCQGLTGYVTIDGDDYLIEPVKGHPKIGDQHPHLLYKRSALVNEEEMTSDSMYGTCGSQDAVEAAFLQRSLWEESQQRKSEKVPNQRRKRSVSLERNVETLVVADQKMTEFYSNEDIETYILTVMNMVSALYRDASIGNAINIVMVRLMLLEDEFEDLDISHHADNTLKSFCKWQASINPGDDSHPNHHDVAILLTRYNICTRMNEPCSTLGLAEVAGMCQSYRSCSVNEDTGLSLAYTVAHELGHNFGANHDGPTNGCEPLSGDRQHVMSPQLSSEAGPIVWSNCSRRDITLFLDRNWGTCLEDPPSDHGFQYPELPPGVMYNVDHQCRLQYGSDAAHCAGMDEVCQTLWCKLPDNRCVTRLEPAAPGTTCAKHKWCYNGQCVQMGDRPQPIDGEWGEWGPWSDCTRTCGAGVSSSARMCDNPPPAHGGKYCVGERRRYRVCNLDPCPEHSPSYRGVQCSSYNHIPYKGQNHTWLPVQIKSAPCQLHCKPEGHSYSVLLSDTVIDGTPCNPGKRDMCINGVCRKVACDWGIDSTALEDRCGVCHGDGTQCTTIRGTYIEAEGNDYVEMLVIPKGARNIRLEEVTNATNYIAVQSESSQEYYLNGQWIVQWSGEYRAGVTLIYYRRDSEQDEVFIPGPTLENLRFLLLFRAINEGVNYEYTVPNENITRVPEFGWKYMDWSACTATCGGGTQVSQPQCVEKEAGLVEETYCSPQDKPPEKSRPCNKQTCPPRWWVGPWQRCSTTCGDRGIRRRTVICVRSLSDEEQMALHDADCLSHERPTEEDICVNMPPCPGEITWETSNWTKCGDDPCDVQRRDVRCSVPGGPCAEALKPLEERQCGNIQCGNWTFGAWSECSSSCGEGFQFRRVSCEGGLKCRDAIEPQFIQKCKGSCDNGPSVAGPSNSSLHFEPEINNEILNLLDPAVEKKKADVEIPARPQFYVEDKIVADQIQILEMQPIDFNEKNQSDSSSPSDLDSNDIALSDQAPIGYHPTGKKMSVHIGEDAVLFLNQLHQSSNKDVVDVSKLKPMFKWKIGQWTRCSVRCGGGTRVRDVSCYEVTTSTLVDDALCVDAKASDVEPCNEDPCLEWILTPWSECSETCGPGIKTREVRCPEPDMCNMNTRPSESATCNSSPCIDWVTGPWSTCSVSCGGGYQFRAVQCIDHRTSTPAEGCHQTHKKPAQRQACATKACTRSNSHHEHNEVKAERRASCHDKLDTKLCATLKHMCAQWYFKVKCCRTCRKYSSHH